VPYVFVESKKALGTACGTTRNVITVSILKNKQSKLNDQINTITGQCERLFVSG
jgi:U4/U6 small nuclear ribonucleoprotein SNU13